MKIVFTLLNLFISIISFGQLENANWCFREYAKISFLNTPPTAAASANGGVLNCPGSPASVSDANGNLLFYTNGNTVWDRNNNVMPNGTGLNGYHGGYGNQTTLIVPKPNSASIYYIFHASIWNCTSSNQGRGFYYTVVDMCLNNGNGDIVSAKKNIVMLNHLGDPMDDNGNDYILETRLTSTPNNDNTKIWLTFFTKFRDGNVYTDRIALCYLIGENGINGVSDGTPAGPTTYTTLNSANFPNFPPDWAVYGNIKFSPDKNYLCDANFAAVTLYRFNSTTGSIQNPVDLYISDLTQEHYAGYGLEFSPNSALLYFTTYEQILYQGKTEGEDVEGKMVMRIRQSNLDPQERTTVVGEWEPFSEEDILPIANGLTGDLQLSIDNKIYVARQTNTPPNTFLGKIQDPDLPGTQCNFILNAVALAPNTTHEGILPQWVHKTNFSPVTTCAIWPKLYGSTDGPWVMIKDYQGDVIYGSSGVLTNSTFYNHIGVFPPASQNFSMTFQYTQSGTTNWIKEWDGPMFSLRSGVVQMRNSLTWGHYFVNGITGNVVTPPVILSNGEEIIAETSNGTILSRNGNSININFLGGGYGTPANPGSFYYHSYNLNTDDLLLISADNSNHYLRVYDFNGTDLIQTHYGIIPVNLNLGMSFYIDNQNKVYYVDNTGVLKKYDYTTGLVSTVTALGFNNQGLTDYQPINTSGYTENKLIVFNSSDNYLYALDVSPLSNNSSKILTSDFVSGGIYTISFQYTIDGNNLYLAGWYCSFCGLNIQIGNQTLLNINQNSAPIYITKLNLQFDFQRIDNVEGKEVVENKDVSLLRLLLSPNPTRSELNLKLYDDKDNIQTINNVTITDQMGKAVWHKNKYSSSFIDISGLKTGVYYITVMNEKGEKASNVFFKL